MAGGELLLGLVTEQSQGFASGFQSLSFSVADNGATLLSQSFTTVAAAQTFANGGDVASLHKRFGDPKRLWEAHACAPLALTGERVARVRRALAWRGRKRSRAGYDAVREGAAKPASCA